MPESLNDDKIKRDFAELVRPHQDSLFAAALQFTSNRADAEDLLQETLMRAYIGFKRSDQIDKPRPWLFKIMRNAYINRYHRTKRQKEKVSYEEGLEPRFDEVMSRGVDDPAEKFFSKFLDSEVEAALDSLPEQFRETITLCDIVGLSYEEISAILECPLGTVRSRISRGRELLFEKLYEYARERGLLPKGEKRRDQ